MFDQKPQPLRLAKEHVTEFQLSLQKRYEILSREQTEINNKEDVNMINNLVIKPLETAGDWKEIPTKTLEFSNSTLDPMK